MQSLLVYVQFISILGMLNVEWPSVLKGLFKGLSWLTHIAPKASQVMLHGNLSVCVYVCLSICLSICLPDKPGDDLYAGCSSGLPSAAPQQLFSPTLCRIHSDPDGNPILRSALLCSPLCKPPYVHSLAQGDSSLAKGKLKPNTEASQGVQLCSPGLLLSFPGASLPGPLLLLFH